MRAATASYKPWHQPGKWLANPAYWDEESLAARAGMPTQIQFIDCTISEGDDCVGHQLNWNTRLGVIERLDAIGTETAARSASLAGRAPPRCLTCRR